MKHLFACLSLAFIACQSPDGTGPEPSRVETLIPEAWTEKLPEDIIFFAGCRVDTLAAARPSGSGTGRTRFTMVQECWTDEIECTLVDGKRDCLANRWSNRYGGTLHLAGSTLTFRYRFEGTTAPERARHLERDTLQEVFKLKHIDWDARLVLEKIDTAFGSLSNTLELTRLP